jgi:hypothetical protein
MTFLVVLLIDYFLETDNNIAFSSNSIIADVWTCFLVEQVKIEILLLVESCLILAE